MADDLTTRIARIDEAIAVERGRRLRADDGCHDGEAAWHEVEVDRLLDLRLRVAAKALRLATP